MDNQSTTAMLRRHLLITALLLAQLPVGLGSGWAATHHPGDEVAFYLTTYGEVPAAEDPQVARAHAVFARVRAVADKNSKRLPKLVVVNSPSDPWALALPDGHIVVSREAVAVCHRQSPVEEAEARLAFILGHELAHLANDDFWHREVFAFLTNPSGGNSLAQFFQGHDQAQARELAADDRGFIYAALAGYRTDTLLKPHAAGEDFFTFWMQQPHTRVQASHPQPRQRAMVLRKRLGTIRDELPFFEFGVRLSHFDYCDDAVYFLRRFQKIFPGREVFNNLGHCYLQLARQNMNPERAFFYWLPFILDAESRANALVRGDRPVLKNLRQATNDEATEYLQQAEEFLRQAIRADPLYLPARMNLAVVYLYRGKPHAARATLDEARTLAPNDLQVEGLDALALYEQSEAALDAWPSAMAVLEKLAKRPDAPPEVVFNTARLLEVRSRDDQARAHWNRLAEYTQRLPDPIISLVCQHQSIESPAACMEGQTQAASPLPWRWPVVITSYQHHSPQRLGIILKDWRVIPFDWVKEKLQGHIYQQPDGRAAVLELDQFVQMQVVRDASFGTVQDIRECCPQPLRPRSLAHETVWSCTDWAVLAEGNLVSEAWWIAR